MDRARAIELWQAGHVRLHLRGRTVRAIEMIGRADRGAYTSRPYSPGGRRWSHRHENDDNPEGVWTLVEIADEDAPVFRRVVSDCLAA